MEGLALYWYPNDYKENNINNHHLVQGYQGVPLRPQSGISN
jgi:hypothetical protein